MIHANQIHAQIRQNPIKHSLKTRTCITRTWIHVNNTHTCRFVNTIQTCSFHALHFMYTYIYIYSCKQHWIHMNNTHTHARRFVNIIRMRPSCALASSSARRTTSWTSWLSGTRSLVSRVCVCYACPCMWYIYTCTYIYIYIYTCFVIVMHTDFWQVLYVADTRMRVLCVCSYVTCTCTCLHYSCKHDC